MEGIIRVADSKPTPQANPESPINPPYRLYNIGNNTPVMLFDFIAAIEKSCGKKAKKNLLPMQPGDVPVTFADIDDLIDDIGFKPSTSITEGIDKFVQWYKDKGII